MDIKKGTIFGSTCYAQGGPVVEISRRTVGYTTPPRSRKWLLTREAQHDTAQRSFCCSCSAIYIVNPPKVTTTESCSGPSTPEYPASPSQAQSRRMHPSQLLPTPFRGPLLAPVAPHNAHSIPKPEPGPWRKMKRSIAPHVSLCVRDHYGFSNEGLRVWNCHKILTLALRTRRGLRSSDYCPGTVPNTPFSPYP